MTKKVRLALGMAVVLLGSSQQVSAQYYYPGGMGMAGGGWGGWGSTAYGDIARGMGMYAAGAGVYNYQTAQARSINYDTMMRYNQYVFDAQQETNRRYARLQAERSKRREDAYDAVQTRLRDNPTLDDIYRGDALNSLLDQLTNPRVVSGSSLRMADLNVSGKIIRAIPFFYASDAITLCLDRLTTEQSWPAVLRTDVFKAERDAYMKAVKTVVAEDEEGDPKPEDVAKVKDALRALYEKVKATIPETKQPDHLTAVNHLKGLAGLSRMMDKPNFQKVLEDLDPSKQATIGQLLGFMQNYNLRFGVAQDGSQRAAYQQLYTMMSSQKARILGDAKEAPAQANLHTAPSELFKDVDPKHLIPSPPAPGPR